MRVKNKGNQHRAQQRTRGDAEAAWVAKVNIKDTESDYSSEIERIDETGAIIRKKRYKNWGNIGGGLVVRVQTEEFWRGRRAVQIDHWVTVEKDKVRFF